MNPVRKIRQSICLILAAGLLATGVTATARGKSDAEDTAILSVTAPDSAHPGDTVPVIVTVARKPGEISGELYSVDDDEPVLRSRAFSAGGDRKTGYRAILFIPLGTLLKSGQYRLEINHDDILISRELVVESRDFLAETIPLGKENTDIKTDNSSKRLEQTNELARIINTISADAPIYPGPFVEPVNTTRRTSHYGDRRTYNYANGKSQRAIHFGIDFGIPVGTPVFASGDGRVVLAESRITTGKTVVIEHLPGVYSLYYHLDRIDTARGEFVRTGTLIGKSGSTGLSTGPHLHWEFRVNGEAVDPDWFVGRVVF